MKISKRLIWLGLSLAVVFAFSMVSGCVSSQDAAPAAAESSDDTVRADAALWNADELGWADMTKAEQELWGVLGWTEKSWEGDAKQPASEDKYWNQLSDKEKEACKKLGYDKKSWDDS